jgi:competence ComEA-like helix-hairpin-helix protein
LAMFATVILTVLAVGLTQVVRVEMLAARANVDRARARYLAKAGFNLATAILLYDDTHDPNGAAASAGNGANASAGSIDADFLQEKWALLGEQAPLELSEGTCQVIVTDASSLININTASLELLTNLFGDETVAQAIVDWRTNYGPFHSIGELVQIQGIAKDWLVEKAKFITVDSRERNTTAQGERRININTADAARLSRLGFNNQQAQRIVSWRDSQENKKFTSLGQLLSAGLLNRNQLKQNIDRISLSNRDYTSGCININTASTEVLALLPGATEDFVTAVTTKREQAQSGSSALSSAQGDTATTTPPFATVAEVFDIAGLTDEDLAKLLGYISTKSATYIIEADGALQERDLHVILQGTVLRRQGDAPVIYGWRELPEQMFLAPARGSETTLTRTP